MQNRITQLLATALLVLSTLSLNAQQNDLVVTVLDSITQEPLHFANLYLKNAGIGASTDESGTAIFPANKILPEDTLVISYIGYNTKSLPIKGSTQVQVSMKSTVKQLMEVVVKYKKPLKPKQIIKKALKHVSDNYAANDVILKCLYRETVQENDISIQLNEAVADVYYTSYPQKKLDRTIWKDWYYDDEYAFNLDADYIFRALLKDFNTKNDQMRIVENRSSDNWSKYDIEVALTGGPLRLLAFDKIKYHYDFLNPRLLNKYKFENDGMAFVNGTTCYVVNFLPEPQKRRFVVDQSRKNKHPIYTGKIYIDSKTFAVVKYDYRLAVERDFGFFARRMPLEYVIEVNYKQKDGKWYMHKIQFTELRSITYSSKTGSKKSVLLKGIKELFVTDIEENQVTPFKKEDIFKSTRFSSIRFLEKPYNQDFWANKNIFEKYPLTKETQSNLEKKVSLKEQFKNRFRQKENLPAPIAPKHAYSFNYHNEQFPDSLHWMADPEHEEQFISYLNSENDYAKNYLIPNRKYQKKFFDDINERFEQLKQDHTPNRTKGALFYDYDSTGNFVLYQFIDSTEKKPVFDISAFEYKRKNIRVTKILPNKNKSLLLVNFTTPGKLSDYVHIIPFGQPKAIDSLANVYSIEWVTDSTLLYTQTDSFERSNNLFWHTIGKMQDVLLKHEQDKTFDISLHRENDQLQCIIQSKLENEVYLIDTENDLPKLQLVQKRASSVFYEIKGFEGNWYMLTNAHSSNNTILHSNSSFPFNWQQVKSPHRKGFIENILVTSNFLVAKCYNKSYIKISYKPHSTSNWKKIDLKHKFSDTDIMIKDQNQDELFMVVSTPALPYSTHQVFLKNGAVVPYRIPKMKYPMLLRYNQTKRYWATSSDGTKIPITLIKNTAPIKRHKGLILKVYGAYGSVTTPFFSKEEAALLLHGYTIAYAHVRGESIMGYDWYENGRQMNKMNSFNDYIACARMLIDEGITSPDYLIGYGNSAGGLIAGWAANEYPHLFNTVILDHAYLDVINTMMDESLPLTTDEYKEWGNPNDKTVFEYINNYSPYQKIKKQVYPNMILIASYMDKQTPAWQIAKHAAKLRQCNTAETDILLFTDMKSGHIGNTTGKEWIRSSSRIYSIVNMKLFPN